MRVENLETLQHPKIEPHRLQMNLKYQIWTCVKLLRWTKTPIWPWESRAHSPANRFWPWVHRKLEMKLMLNWDVLWIRIEFEVNVIWNLNWIWHDCDLNLEMIVIWIWNDCELNWVWSWIWSEFEVKSEMKFEVSDCEFEPRATTSTSWQQNAVWYPYCMPTGWANHCSNMFCWKDW